MTTTQITTQATQPTNQQASTAPVVKHGVLAVVAAAISTTALAAVASAAGVSFSAKGEAGIPIPGFATLTLVFGLIGVGLAAVIARRARTPRSTFVRTTVALTALSYVPDLTFGFDVASAVTLITLHTIAAAIVVPALASRLASER